MIRVTPSKAAKKLVIELLILACLIAGVVWMLRERKALLINESARMLETAISHSTDVDVRIGNIRGNLFGVVIFEDVEVREPWLGDDSLLFKVKSLQFRYRMLDFISKNKHAKFTIVLKKPEFHLRPKFGMRKKRFGFMRLFRDWAVAQKSRVRIIVEAMDVYVGRPAMAFKGIDLKYENDTFDLELPLSHLELMGSDFSTVIRAQGRFVPGARAEDDSFVGSVRSEATVVDWKPFEKESSFDFVFTENDFTLNSRDFLGGAHVSARVDFNNDYAVEGQVKTSDYPLSQLNAFVNGGSEFAQIGKLDLDLRLSGSPWAPILDLAVSVHDGWVSKKAFKSMVINGSGSYPMIRLSGSRIIFEDGTSMRMTDTTVDFQELFESKTYRSLLVGSVQENAVFGQWGFSRPKDSKDQREFVMERSLSDDAKLRFRKYNEEREEEMALRDDATGHREMEVGFEYRLIGDNFVKAELREDEELVGVQRKMKF